MDEPTVCHHDGCSCVVTEQNQVTRGEQRYCCEGCAEGRGCGCDSCGCSTSGDGGPTINPPT